MDEIKVNYMNMEKGQSRGGCGRFCEAIGFMLRAVGMVSTLVAAIIMSKNSQSTIINNAMATATYKYTTSLLYFVIVNSVAFAYSVFSINHSVASIISPTSRSFSKFLRGLLDMVTVVGLGTAIGATVGVGEIAWKGNGHYGWAQICLPFDRFCHSLFLSIIASSVGAGMFLILGISTLCSLSVHLI